MLSPRGYDPLYALMIVSHRVLRYGSPFLHVLALAAKHALLGPRADLHRRRWSLQLALLLRRAGAPVVPAAAAARRALLRAHHRLAGRRAVGLAGARHHAGWEPAEGTR